MRHYLMPSSLNLHKQYNIWIVYSIHFHQQSSQGIRSEYHTVIHCNEIPVLSVIWMRSVSPRKDVPTEERQNQPWGLHHCNAPAWGTNGRIKCAPTLCCKPNHFSRATMVPSGKRGKKKFFLTRNWFISPYSHFKGTGHSWFQQSLTKPHTFKGCEFWGGSLSHQQWWDVHFWQQNSVSLETETYRAVLRRQVVTFLPLH